MESTSQPWFPPVGTARGDGLLMVGGELAPTWLLEAYRRGIFPWPIVEGDVEILAWFSPDPRTVLEFERLHVPRRVRRRMRTGRWQVTFDQAFSEVMGGCAAPRARETGTWITPRLARAYLQLHALGWAHSVEVWEETQLVGGLYGVAVGGFFAGESMFHRQRDASKVALVALVQRLERRGFSLLDVQQSSPHLVRMGATDIPRWKFLRRLRRALELPVSFTDDSPPAIGPD